MVLLLMGKTSKDRFHLLQVQISYLSSKQLFSKPTLKSYKPLASLYSLHRDKRQEILCINGMKKQLHSSHAGPIRYNSCKK